MGSVQSVAVVGAGIVGLATAWHLQEHGVDVTVLDRTGVAAGASWGNAGWLTPAFVAPMPEPALLRYGLRALVSPKSPVYAPLAADRDLARFMAGFLRHSTHARWRSSMVSLLPLVREALPAFDHLGVEGVSGEVLRADPVVAAFPRVAQAGPLTDELEHIAEAGGAVAYELVSGQAARRLAPVLADSIQAAVLVRGQRFINPVSYVHSLGDAVRARGGTVVEGAAVSAVRPGRDGVVVEVAHEAVGGGVVEGDAVQAGAGEGGGRFDAVVVATGAWLGRLCAPLGVKRVVQAGRGYSFSVAADPMPEVPVYLPTARVAVTPLGGRVRVAGMMELRRPDARFDHRRVTAIVDSVRPLLQGVDLDSRADEWVGSRPVTIDGLPLIGPTRARAVYVAGGHGMWGVTLGPVTGRLLAEQIVTGRAPDALRPFDPLR